MLGHEHIRAASVEDRRWNEQEFKNLLHAHATQGEDNAKFSQQRRDGKVCDFGTYWPICSEHTTPADTLRRVKSTTQHAHISNGVRSLAADHIAVALPFAWACCWVSGNLGDGADVFGSPAEKYFATAAERHLSTACRMYNDVSSVARDTAEGNLNSVCFPEFDKLSTRGLPAQKLALSSLAEYEDSCLECALDSLGRAIADTSSGNLAGSFDQRKLPIFRYFFEVGNLYNQLYVLRDISASSVRPS